VLFNTHFDHQGQRARRESARLLRKKITQMAAGQPVLVTGDFNAGPEEEPVRLLTAVAESGPALADSAMRSESPRQGPRGTFNGFRRDALLTGPIDYIFVGIGWRVLAHATLAGRNDGLYPSDHLPVLTVLQPANESE
jgi:endonuclease/exonuclease/phosphatase family metal-dependent hydrolase